MIGQERLDFLSLSLSFYPRVQTGIIRPPVTALTAQNSDMVVNRVQEGRLRGASGRPHASFSAAFRVRNF
jgi:hypothetical protein